MALIAALLLCVVSQACISAFLVISLRQVAAHMYSYSVDLWIAYGRPRGAGIPSEETSFWTSGSAEVKLLLECSRSIPEWAKSDARTVAWVRRVRSAYTAMWVSLFMFALLIGMMLLAEWVAGQARITR
jgi:hypothetical protein